MATPVRIIPSLLLHNKRLVKGVAYRDYRDAGAPASTARIYDAQGADELTLLDIDASKEGRAPDFATLKNVAEECTTPLTFGGGLRSIEEASEAIASGADKLSLTTTAMDDPSLITAVAERFGQQACVVGVDVQEISGAVSLYDHRSDKVVGGDVEAWIDEVQDRGAGEIRISFVNREGTRSGFAIDALRRLRERIRIPLLIEGGPGNLEHVDDAFAVGMDGLVLGTMLIFSDNNIVQIKRHLEARKRPIRNW